MPVPTPIHLASHNLSESGKQNSASCYISFHYTTEEYVQPEFLNAALFRAPEEIVSVSEELLLVGGKCLKAGKENCSGFCARTLQEGEVASKRGSKTVDMPICVLSMEQTIAYLGYFPGALFTLLKGDIQYLLPHSCFCPAEAIICRDNTALTTLTQQELECNSERKIQQKWA